jgi:hypothetical protein
MIASLRALGWSTAGRARLGMALASIPLVPIVISLVKANGSEHQR